MNRAITLKKDKSRQIPSKTYFFLNNSHFCRLYENTKSDQENNRPIGLQTQVQIKADNSTLKQKIISLKQDKTVRNELEPAFQTFIKKPRPFEQCLLSLL